MDQQLVREAAEQISKSSRGRRRGLGFCVPKYYHHGRGVRTSPFLQFGYRDIQN